MVKNTFFVITCICCLFLITGCAREDSLLNDPNAISVDVVNNTEDIIISYAVFYGSGLDEWGEDLLEGEVIEPGEQFTFILPEGTYTFIPRTYEHYLIPGARNIRENTRIQIGGNGLVPLLILNQTESDIVFLYMFGSDGESTLEDADQDPDIEQDEANLMGEDILGDEILPAGLGRFFFIKPGVYDVIGFGYEGEVILLDNDVAIEGEATIRIE